MKRFTNYFIALLAVGMLTFGCQQEEITVGDVSQDVIDQLSEMGFNPDGIEKMDGGYLIEGDIFITPEFLATEHSETRVPDLEQWSTNGLVSVGPLQRTITIALRPGFGTQTSATSTALNVAINRYNAEGLKIRLQRVASGSPADISVIPFAANTTFVAAAGFPSNGNPFNTILVNPTMNTVYGNGVVNPQTFGTIMAHEIGHCVGFRHTDWYDRSISCGIGGFEGDGGQGSGVQHIPGTPFFADGNSFMLSCFSFFSNRPFNANDRTALNYLY